MSATQGARACFYNAEQIARALGGKRCARGYIAKCPAHEDRRPSLSIREAGGRVLFKCFAGCSQESVLQALKEEGLWSIKPSRPHQAVIEATYVYNDELGRPLNRVCQTADKCFFQEHLVANGWIRGLGSRRVLYHLDEVLSRTLERVHVAEGEKDVDRLRSLG